MWLYKFLNIPQLPRALEQQVLDLYQAPDRESRLINNNSYANTVKPELANRPHPKDVVAIKDGKTVRNSRGFRFKLDAEVYEWLHKHLTSAYTDCGLSVITGPDRTLIPHTDQTRRYALLYTFDTGGADVETVFWQEAGNTVHRELREFGTDYGQLTAIERAKFPLRTWVMMNTNVLHSVENLSSDRIQVQMGLNAIPEEWQSTYTKEV